MEPMTSTIVRGIHGLRLQYTAERVPRFLVFQARTENTLVQSAIAPIGIAYIRLREGITPRNDRLPGMPIAIEEKDVGIER
jgi:hypothetical protein